MGLDMYLTASFYVSSFDERENVKKVRADIKEADLDGLGEFELETIRFRVGYWRKANCIHNWFVQNIQEGEDNCREYYVSKDSLKELKELCEKVKNNIDLASELLPAKKGFFFGSYEYDEYYIHDLERTIAIINRILNNPQHERWSLYYHSSW